MDDDLKPGDAHYTAYVGPPDQYDFMGATQFRLLTSYGLRQDHRVLDFGCGSLRAGRMLIPYLDKGCYFGVEPNSYLVEEGIAHHLGQDIRAVKAPSFSDSDAFDVPFPGVTFDVIVAQSIFSHSSKAMLKKAMQSFAAALNPDGMIFVTIIEGTTDYEGTEWVYPGCVTFRPKSLLAIGRKFGLQGSRLNWYHPRQAWYLFAKSPDKLPTPGENILQSGIVLNDPRFVAR